MDEIVEAALKKWPRVPACRGWLGLDARGDWYLRDEQVQAAGPFAAAKGSRIEHEKLREFIGRNYLPDERGAWFFQNGPQRVFVELEATPWVWRLDRGPDGAVLIHAHTGTPARFEAAWIDDQGRLYLSTDQGFGLVHTLDTACAADEIEQGRWAPTEVVSAAMPARFGYRLSPRADAGPEAADRGGQAP
jgi:hypothetical protein